MSSSALYRSFDVWKRPGSAIVRYRCFERLSDHTFTVQSADFYSDDSSQNRFLDMQFLELLAEQCPFERFGAFATIEDAIAAHDQQFSE